jgi:hypothetical protein
MRVAKRACFIETAATFCSKRLCVPVAIDNELIFHISIKMQPGQQNSTLTNKKSQCDT